MRIQRALIKVTLIWKQLYNTSKALQSLLLKSEGESAYINFHDPNCYAQPHGAIHAPTAVGIAGLTRGPNMCLNHARGHPTEPIKR